MFFGLALGKYRFTIAVYVLMGIHYLYSDYLSWRHDPFIDYRTVDSLLEAVRTIVGWCFALYVLTRSEVLRKYWQGMPSARQNPETGKWETRVKDIVPARIWAVFIASMTILTAFEVPSIVDFFSGKSRQLDKEVAGLKVSGNVEITVEQLKDGTLRFEWPGKPVSYVRISEICMEDSCEEHSLWVMSANEKYDNCITSPVTAKSQKTPCATAGEAPALFPEGTYIVYIGRYYDPFLERGSAGWASREFTVTHSSYSHSPQISAGSNIPSEHILFSRRFKLSLGREPLKIEQISLHEQNFF